MLDPSRGHQGRMKPVRSGQPDNHASNRTIGDRLRIKGTVVHTAGRHLAAIVRSRHSHLLAVILHRPATSLLFGVHLHVRHHARHRRSQIRHQQQDYSTELAKSLHKSTFRVLDPAIGFQLDGNREISPLCTPSSLGYACFLQMQFKHPCSAQAPHVRTSSRRRAARAR